MKLLSITDNHLATEPGIGYESCKIPLEWRKFSLLAKNLHLARILFSFSDLHTSEVAAKTSYLLQIAPGVLYANYCKAPV